MRYPTLVILLLLTGLSGLTAAPAQAQSSDAVQADTPATSDAAVVEPAAEMTGHDADAPPAPLIDGNGLLLNFRDAPLQAVLEYLSEQAGMIVVNDTQVQGRITVVNRQPVTLDEAINLINTLLMEQGYTAVRRDRLLRIVRVQDAKRDAIPVRYGNDPDRIGQTDMVITQVVPIKYAQATDLAEDLTPLVNSEYAEMSANKSSNSLIITDTEANVRRIVQIVEAVDKSISSVTELRVFPLQYADAVDTARLIEEAFEEQESVDSSVSRAIQRRFGRFGPGGGGGGGQQDEAQTGSLGRQVKASADQRTNSVVVSASPEQMAVIGDVIQQLDSDTTARESVLVYHVKHILATDLTAAFNELFKDSSTITGGGGGNNARNNRGGNNNNNNQQGGNNNNNDGRGNTAGDDYSGSLVGQVATVADETTNTLMVLTPEKNFPRVMAILESLDTQQPQVLIRILIAEVTLNDQLDIGVEGSFSNLSGSIDRVMTDFGVAATGGGFSAVVMNSDDFLVNIRLLQEVGKLEIVSRPYILASDNQASNILIGQEFPFVTNTRETDAGNTINTIEYRDIGLILNVTPQINPDSRVTLDVSQELSAISGQTVPISEQLDAVIIEKRMAQTRIAIRDGQTIVIGGLMEDRATLTEEKVPILGDLPGVGALFRRTRNEKSKTELLLFLTPEIIRDVEELESIGTRILDGTQIVEEAVEPGTLRKHLDQMKTPGREYPAEEP